MTFLATDPPCPWSFEVADAGDTGIRITVLLSTDPGPLRTFRPFLELDVDEAHATELLGKLSLALAQRRLRNVGNDAS